MGNKIVSLNPKPQDGTAGNVLETLGTAIILLTHLVLLPQDEEPEDRITIVLPIEIVNLARKLVESRHSRIITNTEPKPDIAVHPVETDEGPGFLISTTHYPELRAALGFARDQEDKPDGKISVV